MINLDKLSYAGNAENLTALARDPRYVFVHGDIGDAALVGQLLRRQRPRALIHFAAESHVDRSIQGPADFIETNIHGSFSLLQEALKYWQMLPQEAKSAFRFLHVSTDEVYGSLHADAPAFTETTRYAPNSPYAASKAASDHWARAWHRTYGLPELVTHCSNNYGPFQFPEKLIPLMITQALAGQPLPIYGDGMNVRDWLYVGDHCAALRAVLAQGRIGEAYNIGGANEQTNLDIVHNLCALLDEWVPHSPGSYHRLINFVPDRPGHDRRYAIDAGKIARELGWRPAETFATGLRKTVRWYLDHDDWLRRVQSGAYRAWIETQYPDRAL